MIFIIDTYKRRLHTPRFLASFLAIITRKVSLIDDMLLLFITASGFQARTPDATAVVAIQHARPCASIIIRRHDKVCVSTPSLKAEFELLATLHTPIASSTVFIEIGQHKIPATPHGILRQFDY